MSSIGFWTPVKYDNQPTTLLQKATEFADDYFYLGGQVANVVPEGKAILGSGRAKWWQTVLKVMSYSAVFINLIATARFPGLKQSRTITQIQTILNWFPVGMIAMKIVLRLISITLYPKGIQPTSLLQKATEFVDDYFYLGGRIAHGMPERKVILESGHAKGWQTILKVMSYSAVFINLIATARFPGLKQSRTIAQFQTLLNWFPVGMLVMKVILRLISRFEIKPSQLIPDLPQDTRLQLIPKLPSDLNLGIFKFLKPKDLANASLVCKEWRALASTESLWKAFDLKQLFPKLSLIDKDVWKKCVDLEKYGLSCKGEELIDRRKVIQGLYRMFNSLSIRNDAGITLVTMPEGLGLDNLVDFTASNNFDRTGMGIKLTQHASLVDFGDDSVKKTYQIAITNDILEGSGKLCGANHNDYFDFYRDDIRALKNHVQSLKYDMPEVLEASTLAILTYISSTTCLFDGPSMLTQQYPKGREQFYQIWCFAPRATHDNFQIKGLPFSECVTFPPSSCAVAAVQKFEIVDSKSLGG